MGVVFGFMFWLAPHPLVAALREAEDSEKLQQLSGADAEEQFFSEKGDDVEEIKRRAGVGIFLRRFWGGSDDVWVESQGSHSVR